MIRVGELCFAHGAYVVWSSPGREKSLSDSPLFQIFYNEPCVIVEIDGERKDDIDYDVRVITSKGAGWVYVGAFEGLRTRKPLF